MTVNNSLRQFDCFTEDDNLVNTCRGRFEDEHWLDRFLQVFLFACLFAVFFSLFMFLFLNDFIWVRVSMLLLLLLRTKIYYFAPVIFFEFIRKETKRRHLPKSQKKSL